jgi:lysophospholipid acyltransferase (LPLAT)-like uncharacterized protein
MNHFFKKFFSELEISLITGLAYLIIILISKTLRLKIVGAEQVIKGKKEGKNYIFAFWHNEFFIMPYYYVKKIGRFPISVLASLSKDGEYISRLLHKFGFNTARGSTSYGGENALRLLIKEIENGNDVAVTPDGPRGPRHIVHPGIITLASLTGCSIVPVGYKVLRKKVLKTWDRFIIPMPFTSGVMSVAEPIFIPKNISDSEKETMRQMTEQTLLSVSSD